MPLSAAHIFVLGAKPGETR